MMNPKRVAMIFPLLALLVQDANDHTDIQRAQFASRMATIKAGTSAEAVLQIVGQPNHILCIGDAKARPEHHGAVSFSVTEIWSFGADGKDGFGTLGQIHFNSAMNVSATYGGKGTPITLNGVRESDVKRYLRLIHSMPTATADKWNPLVVMEIANALHTLGKDDGLAVIQEYIRVSPPSLELHQQVLLILRLLHELPEGTEHFPAFDSGRAVFSQPQDPALIPRFPVHLLDDIPVLMVRGFDYIGNVPVNTSDVLQWYKANGAWRTKKFEIQRLSDERVEDLSRSAAAVIRQYMDGAKAELTEKLVVEQLRRLAAQQ